MNGAKSVISGYVAQLAAQLGAQLVAHWLSLFTARKYRPQVRFLF